MQKAEFEYRRISCRGLDHCSVLIAVSNAVSGSQFKICKSRKLAFENVDLDAIKEGIIEAFIELKKDIKPYEFTLKSAVNISGEASSLGFKICSQAAIFKCFGEDQLVPSSGVVN